MELENYRLDIESGRKRRISITGKLHIYRGKLKIESVFRIFVVLKGDNRYLCINWY